MSASVDVSGYAAVLGELRALDRAALADRFARGVDVDVAGLGDVRFRGVVLGLPSFVERATWSLFAKDIVVDDDGALFGWNVRLAQPGRRDATTLATAPLTPKTTSGRGSACFAPFVVGNDEGRVVVDYRRVRHGVGRAVLSRVYDPLVVVDHVDDGRPVFLGVSRFDVGGRAVTTPTWFALVEDGPVPDDVRRVGARLVRRAR